MDKLKRTICLSDEVDMELRLRSASSRKPASTLIEEALKQFFFNNSVPPTIQSKTNKDVA
ncbi:hypothetical protein ACE1CD_15710 [Aerosakkonema sp. BLCC-F183]|uniref:hypothetical protein n=1 Tax=Aerosakkonema sp. BLCC-F183 TaxID=3342834 RepID=UPI0035B9B267